MRGVKRRYAGKVVDIIRLTKNSNPGFFLFFLFCEREKGAGHNRLGQGKGRYWQGSGSNYCHM